MPPFHSIRPLRFPVYPSPNSPCPCSARGCCAGVVLCVLVGLLSLVFTLQACKGPMDAQGQGWPQPEPPRDLPPLPPSARAEFDEGMAAYERQDYTTAAQKIRPLAQAGYARAQNMLGRMYQQGRGVPEDEAQAVQWYRRAAQQGDAAGQLNLGLMYWFSRGVVVPRDIPQAYFWSNLAAAQTSDAVEFRDEVAKYVTNEERAQVQAKTRAWQPKLEVPQPAPPPSPPPRPPAQEQIPLVSKGGVYTLPVLINEVLTLHFVLDTGAAEVNIPADVALTLVRTGTIKDPDDFLSGAKYTLGDGTVVTSQRFRIRSLTIGQRRITNVTASIGTVRSPLLLGQNVLSQLGTWSIDSRRHMLKLGPP